MRPPVPRRVPADTAGVLPADDRGSARTPDLFWMAVGTGLVVAGALAIAWVVLSTV